MAYLTIPTYPVPFYRQVTTLEKVDYLLTFSYNERQRTWSLTVADTDGTPIVAGIKVVCNVDLLVRVADPARPPGKLVCVATTDDGSPPDLEELGEGRRCELVYRESTT